MRLLKPFLILAVILTCGSIGFHSALVYANSSTSESMGWWLCVAYVGLCAAIPIVFLMLFAPLAAHELGHLCLGSLAGFRPERLVLGPFTWKRETEGWRFCWSHPWLDLSGLAVASPLARDDLSRRTALLVLGGPVGSSLLALPAVFSGHYLTQELSRGAILAWNLLGTLGFLSALMLLFSLLPYRQGPLRSDGSSLWVLFRGGKAAGRYVGMENLHLLAKDGVPPREWSQNWVEDATALPDGSTDDAYGCFYGYYWHLARRDYTAAGKCISRAAESARTLPLSSRHQAYLEAAFFFAYYGGDASQARRYYGKGKTAAVGIRGKRIEASLLWAEGDQTGCRRLAEEALSLLPGRTDSPTQEAEKAYLERLLQLAHE